MRKIYKRIILFSIYLFLSIPTLLFSQNTAKIDQLLINANSDFNKDYFISSLDYLNQILNIDSTISEAHYLKGLCLINSINADKNQNAINSFRSAISLDPKAEYPIAYEYLAKKTYFQDSTSLILIKRAIELDSSNYENYLFAGWMNYFYKRYSVAYEYFNLAINFRKKRHEAYYHRGQLEYLIQNDYKSAYKDFNKAIKYSSNKDLDFYDSFYSTYYQILYNLNKNRAIDNLMKQGYITKENIEAINKYNLKSFEFN